MRNSILPARIGDSGPATVDEPTLIEFAVVMTAPSVADLSELRRRRHKLRTAIINLEQCLAAPAIGDDENWRLRVHGSVEAVLADFREHVALTEGSDGFHQDVLASAPHLTGAVERLVRDHARVAARIDALLALTAGDADRVAPAEIRGDGTDLINALMKHRQLGADLVFDAFETDIGGSG